MTFINSPRDLPKVDQLMEHPALEDLELRFGHTPLLEICRKVLEDFRMRLLAGSETETEENLIATIRTELESRQTMHLRPLLNASGTILHTNLGRAPLSDAAVRAVSDIASNYNTLEYDLETGKRGNRTSAIERRLQDLFGVEAALLVNNNAAAVLLTLAALARDREVIVSRGELVEIGGSFRIPEIMSESGARLIEVGTTNKTHLKDYRNAINEHSAALLKVHRSNFRIEGFTTEVNIEELAALGKEHELPLIYDLGSGAYSRDLIAVLKDEPTIPQAIASNADLIMFSGDKLFGGPQAGIIIGKADLIEKLKHHPLLRALRVDKMTLAALEATILIYSDPERIKEELPILQMALADLSLLKERSIKLIEKLQKNGINAELVESKAILGGGSSPGLELDSYSILIRPRRDESAQKIELELRRANPPVISRITDHCIHLDLRTIKTSDDQLLCEILINTLSGDQK